METISPDLRATTPPPQPPVVRERRENPMRVFIDKDRMARFWFLALVAVLIGAAVERIQLAKTLKERERVVIVDPAGTFFVAPLLQFQEARELHAEQSTLAAVAFLERNPKGFDHPDLLKQMFLKQAQQKARAQWSTEEPEFKAKQLHQKVEIGKIEFLQTRSDAVLTQVSGQLIRSGIFQERAFTEAVPFTLKLKMRRNPNMLENGRFPTAVEDFKYEPTH
ncbi:MAG: hypothetical protein H0X34_16885 [Chthoniobacterales bacterium]|nr:hypothetical protein [Chthoniobacterales bacterium]